jgi:hypothetical protein
VKNANINIRAREPQMNMATVGSWNQKNTKRRPKVKMSTNLHCFTCGDEFKRKSDVWRDKENKPICYDCLWEQLLCKWADWWIDPLLEQVENKFDRNYKKWEEWYLDTHEPCKNDHEGVTMYFPNEDICEFGLCPRCCRAYLREIGHPLWSCEECREYRKKEAK